MGVTLTEKAAGEVKKIIDKMVEERAARRRGAVLRVGVQGGGCSGFSYSLNFDTQITRSATGWSRSTASRWPSKRSTTPTSTAPSSTIYDGLEKRGFVFNNPNVTKSCGCGSSFQV